jgi:hypothetical protein
MQEHIPKGTCISWIQRTLLSAACCLFHHSNLPSNTYCRRHQRLLQRCSFHETTSECCNSVGRHRALRIPSPHRTRICSSTSKSPTETHPEWYRQKIEKRHGSHPAHATRGCSRRGLFPCRLHVIIDHDLAQRRRRRGRRVLRHCRRKEKKKRRKTADDRRVSKTLTVHQRICLFPIFSPSVINNCPCLQSRSSPADRLYGHTRESIFAFCSLQELAAIVRISHNWQASVHKMRAIKGCAHVISYTCKTTNVHITAIIAFASHCACRLGHRVDQEAG